MLLFNTRTRRKEVLEPVDGRTLRLYVCGVTPYDTTHIGHALTYLTFDVLTRACLRRGWRVRYVQNVTDIDDDILRKAGAAGEDWEQLGDRYILQFQEDLNALNILPPVVYPRATDEVPMILEMVSALVERGRAYERGGTVYFRVSLDPDYGQLSGYDQATMRELSAQRGADPDDPNKENPLDFILWQAAKPGEPTWESPWGPGRPGWHIECSAMALHHLGPQIDVHGGGSDLIYPHHESEIAQSEAYTGCAPFSRFWVHIGMVRYQGEKMSKSLGNLVLVRNVVRDVPGDALRLYLLGHHYRSSFEYVDEGPASRVPLVERLRAALRAAEGSGPALDLSEPLGRLVAAVEDDLDTPTAVGIFDAMVGEVLVAAGRGQAIGVAQAALRQAGALFGLTSTR